MAFSRGRFASLYLRLRRAALGGLEVPSEIAGAVVAAVNPLITVENSPLPLKLVDVTVDDGAIVLTAAPSS